MFNAVNIIEKRRDSTADLELLVESIEYSCSLIKEMMENI